MTATLAPKPYIPISHNLDPRRERDRLAFEIMDQYLEPTKRGEVIRVLTATTVNEEYDEVNHLLAAYGKGEKLLFTCWNNTPSNKIVLHHRDELLVALVLNDANDTRHYASKFA